MNKVEEGKLPPGMKQEKVDINGNHLMILMPLYDGKMRVETTTSLIETAAVLNRMGAHMSLQSRVGSALIDKCRDELLLTYLESNCSHCLWVDGDIDWQAESVVRMMHYANAVDCVAGMYPIKTEPANFFMGLKANDKGTTISNKYGLLEAIRIPFGFVMFRREILEEMWSKWENEDGFYFYGEPGANDSNNHKGKKHVHLFRNEIYVKDGRGKEIPTYRGEDVSFSDHFTHSGYKIWVDPTINLGHWGQKRYAHSYQEFLEDMSLRNMKETENGC